jgi:hypothetical protein
LSFNLLFDVVSQTIEINLIKGSYCSLHDYRAYAIEINKGTVFNRVDFGEIYCFHLRWVKKEEEEETNKKQATKRAGLLGCFFLLTLFP